MKFIFSLLLLVISFTALAARDLNIQVTIEEPSVGDSKTGVTNLRGWAVTPSSNFPIVRIELYHDGIYLYDIPYGGKRSDVCGAFSFPLCDLSGYSMAFNYNNLHSGSHSFTIRAIDSFGDHNDASVTFSTTSFHNPYIADSTKIDFLNSMVSLPRDQNTGSEAHLDKRIYLENVFVDGKCYDTILNWNTSIQGWRMEEIFIIADSFCEI